MYVSNYEATTFKTCINVCFSAITRDLVAVLHVHKYRWLLIRHSPSKWYATLIILAQ